MKNKKFFAFAKFALLAALLAALTLCCVGCGSGLQIALESEFADGTVLEYTGEKVQFPMGYVETSGGKIQSYSVTYEVVDLADNTRYTDEYATFSLKVGDYKLVYSYTEDSKVTKSVKFSIKDTTAPTVEFLEIPNGLFLQDITKDTINKLPLYSIEDASTAEGIDLKRVLSFKGEGDADFKQWNYRDINNSYEIESFGTYQYVLTATDAYGNQTVATATWKVKDRDWKPSELPGKGILADYSSEGYCNLIEGGNANQYYIIGNNYSDEWLSEYEGANGVLKATLSFNNAAGYGNNTVLLRLAKSFTQEDLAGKYLAVRIYVEGEHIKNSFLFGGNNVAFREEDSTTRALTTGVDGLVTGQWKTYYIAGDTVEHIGMYPNATYNPNTTFYEGGDPATCIQLCFSRDGGYYNDMVLYIDSISIAEILPNTELTVSGDTASWKAVPGAAGYRVDLNGQESIITDTSIKLPGDKGYISVTPVGDGVLTLDAETVTTVYGLDAGDKIAAFDDELYGKLFSTQLKFSTDAEHAGYKPISMGYAQTADGLQVDLGTGYWGVVTGVRLQFPKAVTRGSNTTLLITMNVSDSKYDQIRVYDYNGRQLGVLTLDETNTGKLHTFEVDISAYDGELSGLQFIFGPNKSFTSVPTGVSMTFQSIAMKNTYYPVTVDGIGMMCAGTRKLTAGYTNPNVVQFTTFYNFGVSADDTPLGFSGTVLLDGKKQETVTVVGYPNTDTICFKTVHNGKILTIMKGSYIYYGGIAVEVEETFNAKWNGTEWVAIGTIPAAPADEYVTLADGSKKLIAEKVILTPGFTLDSVVQFTNVYDFGVSESDTPLNFEGTIMLDGEILHDPVIVGYPSNMTIALKTTHAGKLVTIMKGSVIWYGEKAVVVKETFNMKWNGSTWSSVSTVPEIPTTQYITLADGTQRELMGNITLSTHYTADSLVQFKEVLNFGYTEDNTPLGFEGTVLLNGVKVENPKFVGYNNSSTIALTEILHKGKVVTILEGAIFYNDTVAVKVKSTFNATWDGNGWTNVNQIPEPPAKQYVTLADGTQRELVDTVDLSAGYTADSLVQFTNFYDFGYTENNTPIGFEGTVLLDGVEVSAPQFVGYPNNTVICLNNINHKDKVVTIMEGAILYNDTVAVKVKTTFNATWDGSVWTAVAEIPEPPTTQYITLADGTQRELVDTVDLSAGYTAATLVQFTNFYDFGLATENAPIGFEGTVLLDGVEVSAPQFIGYPNNTVICLNNINHKDKVLTVMEGAILYNDTVAVKVKSTFNATWDGNAWTAVAEIPGTKLTATLTAGHTTETLVQFPGFYNFAVPVDHTDLIFTGTVMLDGVVVENPKFAGYADTSTICLKEIDHKDKLLTILEGATLSYGDKTVTITSTFNSTWNGTVWTAVAEVPEVPAPKLSFQYRYGTENLIQVNTNLSADTPLKDFLATDNGCNIDQSGNTVQQFGYISMHLDGDTIILGIHFNGNFTAGQTYVLPKGAVFGFTDGKTYELDKNYTFTFDGTVWTMVAIENPLTFAYRYGTENLIQVNTNLSADTPLKDFLATDNGCNIDQSGNTVQQFGYISMHLDGDTIILGIHFNGNFTAGQTYVLPQGAVFGFTDGKTYELDKNYTFTFDGTVWTVTTNG